MAKLFNFSQWKSFEFSACDFLDISSILLLPCFYIWRVLGSSCTLDNLVVLCNSCPGLSNSSALCVLFSDILFSGYDVITKENGRYL